MLKALDYEINNKSEIIRNVAYIAEENKRI